MLIHGLVFACTVGASCELVTARTYHLSHAACNVWLAPIEQRTPRRLGVRIVAGCIEAGHGLQLATSAQRGAIASVVYSQTHVAWSPRTTSNGIETKTAGKGKGSKKASSKGKR